MLREAHRLELKVVTELITIHTSDRSCFQRAAFTASSPQRISTYGATPTRNISARASYYGHGNSTGPGSGRKAYYWHRFFSHQPDLNFDNPQVMESVLQVIASGSIWRRRFSPGCHSYLVEREGTSNENLRETHARDQGAARGITMPPTERFCWRKRISGGGCARVLRTAMNATWPITFRLIAADLHGDRSGGRTRSSRSCSKRRIFPITCQGRFFCAID